MRKKEKEMNRFFAIFKNVDESSLKACEITSLVDCILAMVHTIIPAVVEATIYNNETTIAHFDAITGILALNKGYDLKIHYINPNTQEPVVELWFNSKDKSVGTIYCSNDVVSEMCSDALPMVYFEKIKIGRNYFENARENIFMLPPSSS